MSTSRNNAAIATLVGGAVMLLVMLMHPTGSEAVGDADGTRHVLAMARWVHGVAIAAIPLLLAGMASLSWRLRAKPALALGGFVSFALASVAVMLAAIMSGFVATSVLDRLPAAGDPLRDVALQQMHYTHLLNQAFAKVYVGLAGFAFVLWSLAMRGDRGFPAALSWFGYVAGLLPFVGVAVGHLHLEVQGFGLVMLLHAAWMMAAAWFARSNEPSTPA